MRTFESALWVASVYVVALVAFLLTTYAGD
jgi:hypothetical protein